MSSAMPELWFERPFDALQAAVARWPGNDFLEVLPETAAHYAIQARRFTYAETLAEVQALLGAYHGLGVRPGKRVGLMLENRPEFFFHWFALNALGASAVPLNADWRGTELEYVIGHSELAVAIVPDRRLQSLEDAARATHCKVAVATHAQLRDAPLPANTAAASEFAQGIPASSQSECALLYTSGTTGRPKGCVLPNEYFIWAGQWYVTVGGMCEVRPGLERMLTPLPTTHMNAMATSTMCMLLSGGCLCVLDRFHPSTWWQSVRQSRATIVHYLGVMPAMLLSAEQSDRDRKHQVRFGFGAGVNAVHHAAFEARFGFPLLEAWAMTETGHGAVIVANHEPRQVGTACFGRPSAAVEVRIGDEDAAAPSIDTAGELKVRSAGRNPRFGFFECYLKDEAATQAAWSGGWFHTGDIVRRDVSGQLHFVDRKKNVIRRSGENISAIEVESALAQHPLVRSVGIVGIADEVRGEEVMACIVARQPLSAGQRSAAAQEITRFALERLAYFKVPGHVHFCAALPLTATEKIQRAGLKLLAQQALAQGEICDVRHLKKRDQHTPKAAGSTLTAIAPAARRGRLGYEGIVLAAPVTVPYERYSTRSAHWWVARALEGLLQVTQLAKEEIDGYCISSFSLAPDSAVGLTQHLGLSARWLDHIPMGGASAVVAVRRAARAVQAGDAEIVACIAADTNHVDSFRHTIERFSQFAQDAVYPYGAGGPNASFAFLTDYYMRSSGATREDFGKLCVAQRMNAMKNPYALLRKPLTLEDYLKAREIASPIHLFDCVMPCAGAEAFMVMREERAVALKLPYAQLRATSERHNAFAEDPIQMRGGWELDKDELYRQANTAACDMDFVQLYDDYPVMIAIQLEDLGFCGKFAAPQLIRENTFTYGGTLPLNTGGGQLSIGQAGAAGGMVGFTEAIRQLTGGAGEHQVKDAQLGLVSGFGMINYDRGLCSGAAVLAGAQ